MEATRGKISLVKEDSSNVVLTVDSSPSDDLVKSQIYKMKTPVAEADYADLEASFQDVHDYLNTHEIPTTDVLLCQPMLRGNEDEREAIFEEALAQYESSGDKERDDLRENSDHNCGDPHCPHKSRIHYQMMLMDLDGRLVQDVYKLESWTPFDYPIIDIGETSKNLDILSISMDNNVGPRNDFRFCNTVVLAFDKDKPDEKKVRIDTYFDFLEGVYFPDVIPCEIRLYDNDNLRAVIKTSQDRRYYSVGLVPRSIVSFVDIGFYSKSAIGNVEVKIIKHHLSTNVNDRLTEGKFTSKFQPEFSDAVTFAWTNRWGWWIQKGFPVVAAYLSDSE